MAGSRRRPTWRKKLVIIAAMLIGLWGMLRWLERHLVYYPSAQHDANGSELGHPMEEVFVVASDGVRLAGWYFPAPKESPRGRLAALLLHGNAGNISHRLGFYRVWLERGLNVLAIDYRGYGRSAGRPDEEGTYRDAQAAYAWLRGKGFAPGQIIAAGESLGGGVATELAIREKLGGLVLQSTFTSIPDVGQELYPWLPVRWISTIKYDTHAKLPHVNCPVLIMHSRADELIRFRHAERNLAAAVEPKLFQELAGEHNDALEAGGARYAAGLERFLATFFK